jgi:hypothetical protein
MRLPLSRFAVLLVVAGSPARPAAAAGPVDFDREIRPILANSCYACHGPDAKARKADLRLDSRADAVAAKAIVPGKAGESELIRRITASDPEEHMPPAKSKKPALTAAQVELLKRWIDSGAKYSEHWAFAKLTRPAVPAAKLGAKNPIDNFVFAELEKRGLARSPEADRVTLIRRLSFDLTGLPPTPEQVHAFVADQSSDAYEKLVDRLLASPHYGERMAVWWLDLVRFADSIGYHSDNPMNVAPYRDYVIDAFNTNKPFDVFTVEQVAGDLLPNPTREQRIATAYNRLLQTTEEGGAQPKEYEAKYAADRVRNFGQVWLGGTIMCAECHNHKFDPYTQKDFYSIAAFFADVQEASVGRREPGMPVTTPAQDTELKRLDANAAKATAKLTAAGAVIPVAALKKERDAVAAAQKVRADYDASLPRTLVTTAGSPRTVRILARGNWLDTSGDVVTPNTPGFLLPLPPRADAKARYTRLDLAKWTVSPENPLPARVLANRLWKLFYGGGISRSLEESGTQGDPPSHPELLDWLASEVQNGWDVKKLVRLMVTSRTYRQSSVETPALRERDPANRLYARQGRYRLDAEFVRDTALAVSGLLVPAVGGPSVKPYQPAGYWAALNFPTREWQNDKGERLYHRSMYTHWQRTFPHPAMLAFDAPSREECTCERPRSNIPQQALALLNDPEFVEAARVLGGEAATRPEASDADRVAWLFQRATRRPPKVEESKVLQEVLAKHRKGFATDADAAKKLLAVGAAQTPKDVPPAELAAWASVARVVLNLHETITRE